MSLLQSPASGNDAYYLLRFFLIKTRLGQITIATSKRTWGSFKKVANSKGEIPLYFRGMQGLLISGIKAGNLSFKKFDGKLLIGISNVSSFVISGIKGCNLIGFEFSSTPLTNRMQSWQIKRCIVCIVYRDSQTFK